MSNYTELKQAIEEVIKTNGQKEITGAIMQGVLTGIVSEIGANATFAGIATPDTAPGNPDANVFYIASVPGKYVNFGDIEVTDQVIILDNSKGYWRATPANIPNGAKPPITPIEWTAESNINNYTEPGLYICTNGIRTNANDNLPINNIGENAGIGFILLVTEASSYENNNIHTRRGQTIILTNRLGNETKQYSRTQFYDINNAVTPPENSRNEWTLWQESQGTTFLGQVTKQQLDNVIDNGIYTGVAADSGIMPTGSTFALIVINNYAVNSAVGMPAIARQVSQTFIYLPLADVSTGAIKTQNGQMLQRTGVGENNLVWQVGTPLKKIVAVTTATYVKWNIDIYPNIYFEDIVGYSPYINIITNLTNGYVKGKIFFKNGGSISKYQINGVNTETTISSKILPQKGYEEITIMKFENETRLIRDTYPTNRQ